MAVDAARKRRARETARRLAQLYGDAECALHFDSPLELLVAVILSAQCTDVRVNIVTRDLFKRYRSAADYANAPIEELEEAVRTTGFYRNKAKNIQACCRKLVERYDGDVPQTLEELVDLDGVGRKTANVVLGTAFGIPSGVVVDTHVTRLSNRLGLTENTDAVRIEHDLAALLPKSEWINFSHRLIWHGRQICNARKPLCSECGLESICPKIGVKPAVSAKKTPTKSKLSTKKTPPKPSATKLTRTSSAGSRR